jgi:hypothetical protein
MQISTAPNAERCDTKLILGVMTLFHQAHATRRWNSWRDLPGTRQWWELMCVLSPSQPPTLQSLRLFRLELVMRTHLHRYVAHSQLYIDSKTMVATTCTLLGVLGESTMGRLSGCAWSISTANWQGRCLPKP